MPVHLCVTADRGDAIGPTDAREQQLVLPFRLTAVRWSEAELGNVVAGRNALAPPCDRNATVVAAARYSDAGDYDRTLTIELDGCRRVIPDGHAPLAAPEGILSTIRSEQ